MKNFYLYLLPLVMMMAACAESDEALPSSGTALSIRAANKVNVCHNGHMISVSINSLPAHLAHGDVADTDGDGYLSGENECGLPVDCDDNDADLTDNCCLSGNWCGEDITYFSIEINFNEDCSAVVFFNDDVCVNGDATWAHVSSNGNTHVYIETDPCGITGCTVTVTDNGGTLYIAYSNCPAVAEGEVIPCEE